MTTNSRHIRLAGINLRTRRTQKARMLTRPDEACSASSSRVIRKPESVKNTDTPT